MRHLAAEVITIAISPNSQVKSIPATLTFTPTNWNLSQTVNVAAVDDLLPEYNHTGVITHTISSGDLFYGGLSALTLTINIADNDVPMPGVNIVQTGGSTNVQEGGVPDAFTIALSAAPLAPVTLTFGPITRVTLSTPNLTFTPSNWDTPQIVTVSAIDDNVPEGIQTCLISSSTTSADLQYEGLSLPSIPANIIDNDCTAFAGTDGPDRIVVTQSADLSTLTITLNGKATTLPVSMPQLLIYAGGGNDNIQVTTSSVLVQIDGGMGADVVFVDGQTASNSFLLGNHTLSVNATTVSFWNIEDLVARGKRNGDIFTVQSVPSFPVEFKGDMGNDTVVASNVPNVWAITGSNSATLDKFITLSTMENLTGGADVDTFTFGPGKKFLGKIDAGVGSDVLDCSQFTTPITFNLQTRTATVVSSFLRVENFVGGKGADTLAGAHQANTWNITGTNSGDIDGLISFKNMENFTGGSLVDAFVFADGQKVTGRIDGGLGKDVLDYSRYTIPVVVDLSKRTATGTAGIANFEEFIGSDVGSSTFVAPGKANQWTLTGLNAGIINGLFSFTNFANLTGGSGTDIFSLDLLGDWGGVLNGGSGLDTLIASPDMINGWNIFGPTSGTLNGATFTAIEKHR